MEPNNHANPSAQTPADESGFAATQTEGTPLSAFAPPASAHSATNTVLAIDPANPGTQPSAVPPPPPMPGFPSPSPPPPYTTAPPPPQWNASPSDGWGAPPPNSHPLQNSAPPRKKPGSVWISFLRVFTWIIFVLTIAGGALYGVWYAYGMYNSISSLEGIVTVAGCTLGAVVTAFLMVAGSMVLLNLATDISAIRIELQQKKAGN